MRARLHRLVGRASIAAVALLAVGWIVSHVWWGGWSRVDDQWRAGPGGMVELHTTTRTLWLMRGRVEYLRDHRLSAVIPGGSSAAGPERHDSRWFVDRAVPVRERAWEKRWDIRGWDHVRLGDVGWFDSTGGGSTSRVVAIPLWIVMLIVGMPGWRHLFLSWRSRRRIRHGCCAHCGYPLDATSSPKCPECGA